MKFRAKDLITFIASMPSMFIMPLAVLGINLTMLRRNGFVAIVFMLFIFIIALGYDRLNDTGDITNYLLQFKFACKNQGMTAYQLAYPVWYTSFKIFCNFDGGFRFWFSTMIAIGYGFLALNIRILISEIRWSKKIKFFRFVVIFSIIAAYSLPFLMTSFRTFISFNVLGFLALNHLYNRKLSYYIKFPCFIFILGLHPFPGIIMLVFYSILLRNFTLFFLISAGTAFFFISSTPFEGIFENKIETYIFGQYQSWNLGKLSELYKYILVIFRKISVLILFLVSINIVTQNQKWNRYIYFLAFLFFVSFFSRTFEARIFYDAFILFIPLYIYIINSRRIALSFLSLGLLILSIDLRWLSLKEEAYSFDIILLLSPIAKLLT